MIIYLTGYSCSSMIHEPIPLSLYQYQKTLQSNDRRDTHNKLIKYLINQILSPELEYDIPDIICTVDIQMDPHTVDIQMDPHTVDIMDQHLIGGVYLF